MQDTFREAHEAVSFGLYRLTGMTQALSLIAVHHLGADSSPEGVSVTALIGEIEDKAREIYALHGAQWDAHVTQDGGAAA